MQTVIIPCRGDNCSKKLRVPSDRGRIIVTCPYCKTSWDWSPPDYPTLPPSQPKSRFAIRVIILAAVLLLGCGAWSHSWVPTLLFLLTFLNWLWCRHKSITAQETLWGKSSSAIWEATASVAGAAAVGFGSVIALVTLLNLYAGLTPSSYPRWLPVLQDQLIRASSWFQDEGNKTIIAIIYISLILFCIVVAGVARRYKKEWKPIRTLSKGKQYITKAVVALQAFTIFTFFSQSPIDKYLQELERQCRWQYGVAKRAEDRATLKRLLAEQMKSAADEDPGEEEDRREVVTWIEGLRVSFPPRINPPQANLPQSPAATPGGPKGGPNHPGGPRGWRPPSWPRPPKGYLERLDSGGKPSHDDYKSSGTDGQVPGGAADDKAEGEKPQDGGDASRAREWKRKAESAVVKQVEDALPVADGEVPLKNVGAPDPTQALPLSINSVSSLRKLKDEVVAQEARADEAERLYGEAIQGLMEAVCEYIGLKVTADPVVEAWADLVLNNVADRVYGWLFPSDPTRLSKTAVFFRRLLSPLETTAGKIYNKAKELAQAGDPKGAREQALLLSKNYAKTKTAQESGRLIEEYTFQWAKQSYDNSAWNETISASDEYLKSYSGSARRNMVKGWKEQAESRIEEERIKDIISQIQGSNPGTLAPPVELGYSGQEGMAVLDIQNDTAHTLSVYYSGSEIKSVSIPPGGTKSVRLRTGEYTVAAQVSAPDVESYAGAMSLKSMRYNRVFYITTIGSPVIR